jgi:hypothetical protein
LTVKPVLIIPGIQRLTSSATDGAGEKDSGRGARGRGTRRGERYEFYDSLDLCSLLSDLCFLFSALCFLLSSLIYLLAFLCSLFLCSLLSALCFSALCSLLSVPLLSVLCSLFLCSLFSVLYFVLNNLSSLLTTLYLLLLSALHFSLLIPVPCHFLPLPFSLPSTLTITFFLFLLQISHANVNSSIHL